MGGVGGQRRFLAAATAAAGLSALAAVSGVAGTGGGGGTPAPASFRLADGSAGCVFRSGELACRAVGFDAALVLGRDGGSRVAIVPVEWDERTAVLHRGESWWHGGFSCRVRRGKIQCLAGDGAIAVGGGRLVGVR